MCTRPFLCAKMGEIICKMARILLLGLLLGPKWPKLSQNGPKGSPNCCVPMTSATVHNFGVFWQFLARTRAEISPKMVSINCYWASKWTQIFLEWPQNDSQTPPTVLYSCGAVFWGSQVIFGWEMFVLSPFDYENSTWNHDFLEKMYLKTQGFWTTTSHNLGKYGWISIFRTISDN